MQQGEERLQSVLAHLTSTASSPITMNTNTLSPVKSLLLEQYLMELNIKPNLQTIIDHLSESVIAIAEILRETNVAKSGSQNVFGDEQLTLDIRTDEIVVEALQKSGVVSLWSSEESPNLHHIPIKIADESSYSVGYDPLDGSSIIGANFAVGSIFAIWPGNALIGQKARSMSCAMLAQYGPRTTIILAVSSNTPAEFLLINNEWKYVKPLTVKDITRTFAPANLRAQTNNLVYRQLIDFYLGKEYTLRYSGGLVPDVVHILTTGSGIYLSPISKSAPAKLRLLYELCTVAFIIENSGGRAVDHNGNNLLDIPIVDCEQRSGCIVGSNSEVQRYCDALCNKIP